MDRKQKRTFFTARRPARTLPRWSILHSQRLKGSRDIFPLQVEFREQPPEPQLETEQSADDVDQQVWAEQEEKFHRKN